MSQKRERYAKKSQMSKSQHSQHGPINAGQRDDVSGSNIRIRVRWWVNGAGQLMTSSLTSTGPLKFLNTKTTQFWSSINTHFFLIFSFPFLSLTPDSLSLEVHHPLSKSGIFQIPVVGPSPPQHRPPPMVAKFFFLLGIG